MKAEINWGQVTPSCWRQGQPNGITTKPGTNSQGKAQDARQETTVFGVLAQERGYPNSVGG